MNRPDCKHPSAYCTMRFQTPDRNVEETVWNSRDQAVPAAITLGKLKLEHADSHRDEFKPFHVPRVGSRMWIDPVLDRAEAAAEAAYLEHQHDPEFIAKYGEERRAALATLVVEQIQAIEAGGAVKAGALLVVVTADHAARIQARLEKRGAR